MAKPNEGGKKMKTTFRGLAIITFLLAGILFTTAGAQAVTFQDLLAAAKEEAARGDTFLVYASNPKTAKTRKALFDAFKKKYNLVNFKFEWLSLFPSRATTRIIAEARANKRGPSVFMSATSTSLTLNRQGLFETFDWVGTFAGEFPQIKEPAVDRVPPVLRGKVVIVYDGTRSLVYNTNMLKPEEVPDNFDGLVDPKWRRKFAMSGRGGSAAQPFNSFSLVWGEEKTLEILRKILANKPIFKRNVPPVINAVAGGEAVIGLGSIHETERMKMKGAPVEWKTYGNYVPVTTLNYTLTKNSPHPNLGRLFIAWFAAEGIKIFEEMEFSSRITFPGSRMAKLLKERAPNAKILEPVTLQDLAAYEAFSTKVVKIVSTLSGGR